MSSKQVILALFALAFLALIFAYRAPVPPQQLPEEVPLAVDPLNLTYDIERNIVRLENGVHEQEVELGCKGGVCPTVKYETRVFGEPVYGDLNGDGADDAAMLVTQKTGGTGTFYYAVAALATEEGGEAAQGAVFLGDRIAPQNIGIEDGTVILNYADRRPEESFATPPSLGMTARIKVVNGALELQ